MAGSGDPAASGGRRADAELARRVLRGETRAESEFVERLLPHLRVVARAILWNAADVDDAVQVALMRVLDGLPKFRGESSLVHWSRRVAAHACLRLREQNQRRTRVVELVADPPARIVAPPQEGAFPPEVEVHLQRLPERQRQALVLRHVLGHSVAEISDLVDAPVDTVKSRLLYARRSMREMLRSTADTKTTKRGAQG